MLNIIVADDHDFVREALVTHLRVLDKDAKLFEASSYPDVLALAEPGRARADGISLVLLDLKMPGLNDRDPYAGLRRVCRAFPKVPVVIFSGDEDHATITGAMANGARGYIPKTTRGRSLVNALTLVLSGEIYVPPVMLTNGRPVPNVPVPNAPAPPGPAHTAAASLSVRELAALRLLAQGKTNKEIARDLGLQDVTVKMHLSNAYKKLGANNRVEAVRIATELNIT
jgi:DNA-binding NarL/FixJ family response regulator